MAVSTSTWKYLWNPLGYDLEKIEISTFGLPANSDIFLSHTFFKVKGFKVSIINPNGSETPVTVSAENAPGVDILFNGKDRGLSELIGIDVYRKITLKSQRVLEAKLLIEVSFLGDLLDPSWFNQYLNQEADVTHRSLTVESLKASEGTIGILKANSISGAFGTLDEEKILFKGLVEFSNGDLKASSDGLETKKEEFFLRTATGYLKYNSNRWVVYDPRLKKEVPLVTFAKNIEFGYKIPILTPSDPCGLTTLDWLELDPGTETFSVPTLKTKKVNIDGFEIFKDSEGLVHFGSLVTIGSSEIKIGPLVINKDFITRLSKLQTDVESLKGN